MKAAAAQLQANVDYENGRPRLGNAVSQLSPDMAVALYDPSGRTLLDGAPRWPASAVEGAFGQAARGGAAFVTVEPGTDRAWRVLAAPVQENGRTLAVLEVGRPEGELQTALGQLLLLMGLAVPATLALAAGGGLFLAHRALSPIDRITRTAGRIGAEDLSRRLPASV